MQPKKHFYAPRKKVSVEDKITPRMRQLAAEALENQIRSNDPAFVNETLDRLTRSGVQPDKAKEKILGVLCRHLYTVMHDKKQFNEGRYKLDLEILK